MNVAAKLIGLVPPQAVQFLSRNQWRVPALRRVFALGASLTRNRDGSIQHGVGKGLRFNAGSSHSAFVLGTHKPSLQKALAKLLRPGMVVFDAGANVGYYAAICQRLVTETGSVVCFEPLASNADQIDHNMQLNGFRNVIVRREALGNADGTARFSQSAESTWGSLTSVGKLPDKYVGEIEVALRKLDSVMAEAALQLPDLLKIDVEGAEIDLLKGAARTIASARPLLTIELHGTNAGIAEILAAFKYESVVLDYHESVAHAPWNAYALAAPAERSDLVRIIRTFAVPALP